MPKAIYVINPNSSATVTSELDAAVAPLRLPGGPEIRCVTLAEGPPGVESQGDVDRAALAVQAFANAHRGEASAFVIACFSDPGLHGLRETENVPVLGISESAVLTALSIGHSFGVIAILPRSIPRHLRNWGAMGVMQRCAGEIAIGRGVSALADREATLAAMCDAGRRLRDERGAQVLVMGCAGMAPFRQPLQEATGLPVVEPTQAAVAMALGRVQLGW
ncbi:aspartate/glutamate racemase family protein [Variovorax ginsengisoli]|uniref:Aspartate/glutamate racemase family protein n=1 Tax=Variovorax ginsengisoli TaxID=363844 RepID=A0ABT8SDT0_9BURK|nr:aspartate/glutamate racemase family protein [Variovorax ginsengisoli]MDN8617916.1 aspartate/glutamate racemase family protein [Variovorax ginsengisoli]MDO1537086.1 aspartate/glutamate racemase family protein [Variovorax ginsengisoli]